MGDAEFVALAARVGMNLNCGRDFALRGGLADALAEASGKFTVRVEKVQAMRHAAEITRGEAQPSAGFPVLGVKAGDGDFIESGKISW